MNKIENLTLICMKCHSRMRSSTNLDDFKIQQKQLMLREVEKLKEFIAFYMENSAEALKKCEEFIKTESIQFYYEKESNKPSQADAAEPRG